MALGIFSKMKEKTETMSVYLPRESVYYESLADVYRLAKYAIIVILTVFVSFTTIMCRKDLRVENFRYLFKYIEVDPASSSANYRDIYYSSGSTSHFDFYKGDLVLAGDEMLKLYSISGKNILYEDIDTENAICDADGKYLITYYPGESTLAIFNSFAKLYEITLDHPIVSVSAGDDGSFAVITRDNDYRSAVYVYNSTFKHVYSLKSNEKYAASAAVSPNGKYVSVLSYSINDGVYSRELSVRSISKDKEMLVCSTDGKIPLKTGFFDEGQLFALYSDGISFYNAKFKENSAVSFDAPIQFYRVFDDRIVVITGETKAGAVLHVYDSDGKVKFTQSFPFTVIDVHIVYDKIYLLASDSVYRIDGGDISKADFSGSPKKMYVFDDGNVMICFSDHTALINDSDFKS